jgi:hypothetical protein
MTAVELAEAPDSSRVHIQAAGALASHGPTGAANGSR